MLVALRSDRVTRVTAWKASRGNYHYCPSCNEELILRQGVKVSYHFAHRAESNCDLSSKGEGERHEEMKFQMGQIFERLGDNIVIDFEVRFPTIMRRADVVVKTPLLKFVIECQASSISVPEWEERTKAYNLAGYAVLWVWDSKRVGNLLLDDEWQNRESGIPLEIRNCWRYSWANVYVLSTKGNLKACFFHFRTDTLADKVYFDPPMNIRSLTSTETGLVFLQLGEGKFWNDNICEDNLYLAQSRRERQEFLNQYLKLTDFDLNMLKTLGEEYVSDKRQRFKDLQQAKRTGWLSNYQQKMIEGFEKSGLRCFVDLEVN